MYKTLTAKSPEFMPFKQKQEDRKVIPAYIPLTEAERNNILVRNKILKNNKIQERNRTQERIKNLENSYFPAFKKAKKVEEKKEQKVFTPNNRRVIIIAHTAFT